MEFFEKKHKSKAFGKDVYYLGYHEEHKDHLWLEAASWDCGWYWGFGYIEVYTNQRSPNIARDINSHTHWDSMFKSHNQKAGVRHAHKLSDLGIKTPFTEREEWTLSELMATFYTLKDSAELFGRGGSHFTTNPAKKVLKNKRRADSINQRAMPAVFAEIYKILTPTD